MKVNSKNATEKLLARHIIRFQHFMLLSYGSLMLVKAEFKVMNLVYDEPQPRRQSGPGYKVHQQLQ